MQYNNCVNKFLIFFYVFIALTSSFNTKAQYVSAGVGMPIIDPLGNFKNHSSATNGISCMVAIRPEDAIFMVGFEYATYTYATFSERVPFNKQGYQGTEADKTTNNDLNHYRLFSKLFLFSDIAVRPYIDARFGISQFRTKQVFVIPYQTTRLKTIGLNNELAFNYGGGIGAQANLSKIAFDSDDPLISVMVDFKIGYNQGTRTIYQNIKQNGNPYSNDSKYNTRTSFIDYTLCLYFEF